MTQAEQLEQFVDRLGLRYIKGKELTPYWSQVRKGVRNSCPDESLWPNIVPTLMVLDETRHKLGCYICVTSSYRRPAYNAAVGGEPNSFHMRFSAIDFQAGKDKPSEWAKVARSLRGKKFVLPGNSGSFVFRGGIGLYATFVHLDTRGQDANW